MSGIFAKRRAAREAAARSVRDRYVQETLQRRREADELIRQWQSAAPEERNDELLVEAIFNRAWDQPIGTDPVKNIIRFIMFQLRAIEFKERHQ